MLSVVLLAPLLWLGWPCAAPPPPLLRALRPIPNGVGVICDFFFFLLATLFWFWYCEDVGRCMEEASWTAELHTEASVCSLKLFGLS